MKLSLGPLVALLAVACSHPAPAIDAAVEDVTIPESDAGASATLDADVIFPCKPTVCVCGSYGEGCHLEGPPGCMTSGAQNWCENP
jgi:hypothetical protein